MNTTPFSVGSRSVVLDGAVNYMDIAVAGGNWRMSQETWEAISYCGDAIAMTFRLMLRGLPDGPHPLPVESGPFADAARLDGRWRELMEVRHG